MKTFLSLKTFLINAILSILISTSINAQNKTVIVPPSDTITPFELTDNQINFPLQQAYPVGDINGDGLIDMGFYNYQVADERTSDLSDIITKSVIATDTAINSSKYVFYNDIVNGIGDINNDGYDDLLKLNSKQIVFGGANELTESDITLNFPDAYYSFLFNGDINGDGIPEYIITNNSGYDTSIYVFSGIDTIPIIINRDDLSPYISLGYDEADYAAYDYDDDGQTELCIASSSVFDDDRIFCFFNFDFGNHVYYLENVESFNVTNELIHSFPHDLSDINGDGLLDACHFFYVGPNEEGGPKFDMEVLFGKHGSPYFENSVIINLGHPANRTAYFCGDVTGDGCADVCGNYNNDSLVVYKGSNNIESTGFQHYYLANASMNNNQILKVKTYMFGFDDYDLFYMNYEKIDYNQDGINDLIFNYWQFDDNLREDGIGTALVMGEELNTSDPVVFGKTTNNYFADLKFGDKIQNIGDFNNDGYDDWAALAVTGSYLNVYFGSSVLDDEPDIRFLLPQINKSKCFDWSFGDVNGDGINDFVISNSSEMTLSAGSYMDIYSNVFILYGKNDMLGNYYYQDADVVLHDNGTFSKYGYSVTVVGDYNADGFEDIVVGGSQNFASARGALMYYGSDENIGPDPDLFLPMPCSGCFNPFPDPITRCGDINADGYDDFTLGDDNCDAGRCLVYFGGPDAGNEPALIINNPYPEGRTFGLYTSKQEGDINGDGYPDLVQYNYFQKIIYFYYGGPEFDTVADRMLLDTSLYINLPTVDYIPASPNSSYSNLIVGDYDLEGSSYRIYSGGEDADNEVLYELENPVSLMGKSVASGDFDNDGYIEIYAGISHEKNYGWRNGGIIFLYEPYLVSVEEEEFDSQQVLKVYPNPARNNLSVEISNSDNSPIIINVYDISGKLVNSQEIKNVNSKDVISIPINKLGEGIYILKIQQSGETYYSKFVVNK